MIIIQNLSKKYGKHEAVRDVSLEAQAGRVTALLGPNGSGKSTTLRVLLGLDRPSTGTLTINEKPVSKFGVSALEVGALLDANSFHPHRTGLSHLRYLAASAGLPSRRVTEVLNEVELASQADRPVKSFSLGMKQRLGLAAALLGEPKVVVLDEPANGLDADGIVWLRTLIQQLAADGRTVLMCSHVMSEVAEVADDVSIIYRGKTVAGGTLSDFLTEHGVAYTRVASSSREALYRLLHKHGYVTDDVGDSFQIQGTHAGHISKLAAEEGLQITGLSQVEPSLESAYFNALHNAESENTNTFELGVS